MIYYYRFTEPHVRETWVRVFAQAINLLTWTAYTGLDPEILFTEIGRYPQSKQVTGGIQIEF